MKQTRRKFSAIFKAKVAIEALKKEKQMSIRKQYDRSHQGIAMHKPKNKYIKAT